MDTDRRACLHLDQLDLLRVRDDRMTASGLHAKSGHTLSADWSILPKGTRVYIDGVIYTVEDNGVWGNSVDIFFDSYQECVNYGLRHVSVYKVVE